MLYKIKTFALVKEKIGKGLLEIDLAKNLTKNQFIAEICRCYPSLKKYESSLKLACDYKYMLDDEIVKDTVEEIAIFSSVSGG
ncbi:MAG: MoaD/ThiS family protein [SAR324 cluster bacterium]|nr:MoaD/ThiS family protein [SAR324 cluster bacterium]